MEHEKLTRLLKPKTVVERTPPQQLNKAFWSILNMTSSKQSLPLQKLGRCVIARWRTEPVKVNKNKTDLPTFRLKQ